MKVADWLDAVRRPYIETAPLIYYIEANPTYIDRMDAIITGFDHAQTPVFSSAITLAEVLVHPMRSGNAKLAQTYRDILLHSEHFRLLPITGRVAEIAADLRARYSVRTPDALHLAAALDSRCDAFLTNDVQLTRVTDIDVQILDDLELPPQSAEDMSG